MSRKHDSQGSLPVSPATKKPVIIVKNEPNTYVQLFDDNAPEYLVPVLQSTKKRPTSSLNESGSDASHNTSLESAWTDVVSSQHSSSSSSSSRTLYARLSHDKQKYYKNSAAKFYQDVFSPLQFDKKIKLQSLLKQMDRNEPLSDADREIFTQLMATVGFNVATSVHHSELYEVPVPGAYSSETGTDDYYTEPSLSHRKELSAGVRKTIRKEATLDENAYDLYAPIDEKLVTDGLVFISPETQFGFDEEEDPNGYIKVDAEDGEQAIYSAATDRSLDPLYGDVNAKRNPLYNITSSGVEDNQDLYALATDRSGDPLYGSKDQQNNQDLYALATDRSGDPLYGTNDQQDNQELYALATDRSREPLYGARPIPSSNSVLKSESSVGSSASDQTADAYSENEYEFATDRSKDPLYGPINQAYDEEVEYAVATDRSKEVYGVAQPTYSQVNRVQKAQQENVYNTYEALPSHKKRLPEPLPRQEKKPVVPARHSLLQSQSEVTDTEAQPLIMPDDTLPKGQQDFITTIFNLIKTTPIEKEEQKEVLIDKAPVSVARKSFVRRNLHIIIPATIAVGGAVAFLAYWFSRDSSSDPESMTTSSPDSEALTMCKNASNAALNLGLRLVDGLFSITRTQANTLCASAGVPTTENCASFLTQNCTQLFSSQASSAGGGTPQYFGFFEAVSNTVTTLGSSVATTTSTLLSSSADFTSEVLSTISTTASTIVDTSSAALNTTLEAVSTTVSPLISSTTAAVSESLSTVGNDISSTVSSLATSTTTAFNSAASSVGTTISTLTSQATSATAQSLTTIGESVGTTVSSFATSTGEVLTSMASSAGSTVSTLASSTATAISETASSLASSTSTTLSTLSSTITEAASTLASTTSTTISTLSSTASQAASTLASSTASTITSTVQQVTSTTSSIWSTISSTISSTVSSTLSSTFSSTSSTFTSTSTSTNVHCLFSTCNDARIYTSTHPGAPEACACITPVLVNCPKQALFGC